MDDHSLCEKGLFNRCEKGDLDLHELGGRQRAQSFSTEANRVRLLVELDLVFDERVRLNANFLQQ